MAYAMFGKPSQVYNLAGRKYVADTTGKIADVSDMNDRSRLRDSGCLDNDPIVAATSADSIGAVLTVASRTGNVVLSHSDVSGLGSAALVATTAFDAAGAAAAAQAAAEAYADAGDVAAGAPTHLHFQTLDSSGNVLTTNGGAATALNQVAVVPHSSAGFHGRVVAREAATGDSSYWIFDGIVKQGADNTTTALVAAVTATLVAQDAGASAWTVGVNVDVTDSALKITVSGDNSKTIDWLATVDTVELVSVT